MNDKTELIFGYGSLVSFRGLYRNGSGILNKIKILDAFRAQIKCQRGFAIYLISKMMSRPLSFQENVFR